MISITPDFCFIRSVMLFICLLVNIKVCTQTLLFRNASDKLGPALEHRFIDLIDPMPLRVSSGIAAADVDNDGDQDFFCVLGDTQFGCLLINTGQGDFENMSHLSEFGDIVSRGSGPLFFHYNNDAWIDLIVGSVDGSPPRIFVNEGAARFSQVSLPEFDILQGRNTISIAATDYNRDGYTDLFFSHWSEEFMSDHFWENQGNGRFLSSDEQLGFYNPFGDMDFFHAANFADINGDDYPDLLLSSDFGTSQIWYSNHGSQFILDTTMLLDAENAMGGTIGDFDNDGDFDWFVTSVYDDDGTLEGNWGGSGNRFYVQQDDGTFSEGAEDFGLKDASWGWGTSFGDLNNDGFLDIVAVNGWPQGSDQFKNDRLRVFMSQNGEFFDERAEECDLIDTSQGRGIICFDFDLDGDLDILVSNYRGPVTLWENLLDINSHFLSVHLIGPESHPGCLGSKVQVFAGGKMFSRMISAGSNYVSQNPAVLHFGLGKSAHIDSMHVYWTDGSLLRKYNLHADRHMVIRKTPNTLQNDSHAFVYPNPSTQQIRVFASMLNPIHLTLNIHDIKGHLIYSSNSYSVYDAAWFHDIDISPWTSGVYVISLSKSDQPIHTLKFVKP